MVKFEDEFIYVWHNEMLPDRVTLLFIHGLGDSGACFQEVFQDKRFDKFNIIVPDLNGHGNSSASIKKDYSFNLHLERLWNVLEKMKIKDVIVIGHSMGGDIGTLLCASDQENIIKKFVNVEGNLDQFDLFISNKAVNAAKDSNFEHWFSEEFIKSTVSEDWAQKYASAKRYATSLRLCRPEAFLANSQELYRRNTSLPGKYKSEIGRSYCTLSIPKIFCYGTKSISSGTIDYLKENNLEHQIFNGAFHWPMIDNAQEFYSFLYEFVS